MKSVRACMILLATVLLASTGPAAAADEVLKVEPGTGLAFGAFDITDSDLAVTHVVLMRIKPTKMYMGSSGEKGTITYTNGEFYSGNLSPGVYSVIGFFSGSKFFALEKSLRTNTLQIEPGRVSYAGTYKLTLEKGGLFRQDKGSFARIDTPDAETQLLRWLAKELDGSEWGSNVDARLSEGS